LASHWFWPEFAKNWEPETFAFYQRYCVHGAPVIDVGSWIGPTAVLALWHGASAVRLVEANPATVELLRQSQKFDRRLAKQWEIMHVCVAESLGERSFGTPSGQVVASSAASDRGTGSVVKAMPYASVLQGVDDPCLIKIDVEGTESRIFLDVIQASPSGAAIWLSWHPPFWNDNDWLDVALPSLYSDYWVLDAQLKPLDKEVLRSRLTTTETHPAWGTKHGNFFESALLHKRSFHADGRRKLTL
jgi:FkbM family methyltransferase